MEVQNIPKHVAIIMDGNGRWGLQHQKTRIDGHRQGAQTTPDMVLACAERGIQSLTLFAFSSENKKRPYKEIQSLIKLFTDSLTKDLYEMLSTHQIRLRFIGEPNFFGQVITKKFNEIEEHTKGFNRMLLNVAANYGGRWDIAQAAHHAMKEDDALDSKKDYKQMVEAIDERILTSDVDLLIRTGGEHRISNFLIWQSAYAEIYFSDTLWPDFSNKELDSILLWYANRERRFGYTTEQVSKTQVSKT